MGKKAMQVEILKRLEVVFSLIMKGAKRAEIVQYGAEKWDLSRRQVDNYISKAKMISLKESSDSFVEQRSWHIANRKYLLSRVARKPETLETIRLQKEIASDLARIQGVYDDRITVITQEEKEIKFQEVFELAEGKDFEVVEGKSDFGT